MTLFFFRRHLVRQAIELSALCFFVGAEPFQDVPRGLDTPSGHLPTTLSSSYGGTKCADIGSSPIRNRLRTDVTTRPYLNRYDDYGSPIDLPDAPAYYGFAGGQNQWQFTSGGQTNFSLYPGEVWADMFLGWVYENLAPQRMDYMNEVMPEYLSLFN